MAIPGFNDHGWLPEGIHDCTLAEAEARFGGFHDSDRRPQLWSRFKEFFREAKVSGILEAVLLDGSFVTTSENLEQAITFFQQVRQQPGAKKGILRMRL